MSGLFDLPWMVIAAAAIGALVALVVVWRGRRRAARLGRLAEASLLARLAPDSLGGTRLPALRLGLAALLAGVALAGPRWGEEPATMRGAGVDVVLALDASLSMLATDERPTRLERVKQEVRRYRALSPGDRVAMLAFAGRSYILTPLTVDDGALELFLDNLDPSVVGQAGSSLARTIAQATDLLRSSRSTSDRALILMTDGEAFEPTEEILEATRAAAAEGIAIVAVGFGTEEGGTIPIREGDQVVPKRDENNAVVVTRYHPETLRAIATESNGTFIEAGATDKAARIRAALQRLRASTRSVGGGVTKTPVFQWFLLPAFLLILWDTLTGIRRRRVGAHAAAALLLSISACAIPGRTARQAAGEYKAGRFPQAAMTYRRAIREGDARPAMLYNLGTSLVSADSFAAALEPLERAGKDKDVELAFRSLFNSGLAHLGQGLAAEAAGDSARETFSAAVKVYKQALLMRPGDRDAKWNYELALRKEQANGGGGGGGGSGGGGGNDQNDPSEPDTPEPSEPSGGLGQQRAEQLLNAAAREERGVQGKKQKQSRPQPPPGGKDW
jgi:Ca-activated chloride channel family protein